ncbi:MAG: cyclic nucleotide-binding domain-containing protein [Myxococcota bacterium]|nr:cyclic nucleotide-binding domain-containing protein [Myxococcota bacterium]
MKKDFAEPAVKNEAGGIEKRSRTKVVVKADRPKPDLSSRTRVVGRAGEGGGALVEKVFDENLQRTAAMKVLRHEQRADPVATRRLLEEAQITAQLDHAHIAPVHELGITEDGVPFFTMKLVEGRTLKELLAERIVEGKPRPATDAELFELIQIYLKICDAVAFAHERGVIHRDLKPANIMIGDFGEVYVMDWGIAKIMGKTAPSTATSVEPEGTEPTWPGREGGDEGAVVGTPGYMAHEQAVGDFEGIDERTDVFALGAILYSIITGLPPYDGKTSHDVYIANLTLDVISPKQRVAFAVPEPLCDIALRALDRSPDKRYQSALELRRAVEDFLQRPWQLRRRRFQAGEDIVREGEEGGESFVVAEGRCEVWKGRVGKAVRIAELGPGDVFGETAALTGHARTATVRAATKVEVLVINRNELWAKAGDDYLVGRFLRALAHRFAEQHGRNSALERELGDTELMARILSYMTFFGERVAPDRQEVRWSELCEAFADNFGKSVAEITAAAERLSLFERDPERDVLALVRMC